MTGVHDRYDVHATQYSAGSRTWRLDRQPRKMKAESFGYWIDFSSLYAQANDGRYEVRLITFEGGFEAVVLLTLTLLVKPSHGCFGGGGGGGQCCMPMGMECCMPMGGMGGMRGGMGGMGGMGGGGGGMGGGGGVPLILSFWWH
ncbi:hypothetical protein TELCIR_03611 [Teladorsagia circumcincta]|uniref:Uncharacterized protein n=1 Tax=Teladorsagia circumcincta TaxID=45464 RepID=A0A2G9UVV7_TELCI|nr:hypothetical protein TELCIR_03611 [Teladorsagia circumcincta]